jgi:hypothetical protein
VAVSQDPVNSSNPARPHGRLPIKVTGLADLPGALGRLARLVAVADHLDPKSVGRLTTEHARTVLALADVVARRDTVPGTTAPPLLGAAGELLGHAAMLADVGAATRAWRSGTSSDVCPLRQLREIRRQLARDRSRLHGSLTDSDLRVVVASLRPALQVAPAVRHAIARHIQTGTWQEASRGLSGHLQRSDVLVAAHAASESAVRLAEWLPTSKSPAIRRHRSVSLELANLDHNGRTR